MKKNKILLSKLKVILLSLLFIFLFFESFLNIFSFINVSNRKTTNEKTRPDVVCFGDSFVYGLGVDRGDDYPSILNEMIDAKKVENHGEPGINSSAVLGKIRKVIEDDPPELITVQIGINNFWNKSVSATKRKDIHLLNDLLKIKTFRFLYIVYNSIQKKFQKYFIPKDYVKKIYPKDIKVNKHGNILLRLYDKKIDGIKDKDFITSLKNNDRLSPKEKQIIDLWLDSIKNRSNLIRDDLGFKSVLYDLVLIDNRIRNNMFKEALEISLKRDDDISMFLYRGFLYYYLGYESLGEKWIDLAGKYDEDKRFSRYFNEMETLVFKEKHLKGSETKDSKIMFDLLESSKLLNRIKYPNNNETLKYMGGDIYLNFYRLNCLILKMKNHSKISRDLFEGYLFSLYLQSDIDALYKFYSIGNPWLFVPFYKNELERINQKILSEIKEYSALYPELKKYLYFYALKLIQNNKESDFKNVLDIYISLTELFPDDLELYNKILSEYLNLSGRNKKYSKKLYNILKDNINKSNKDSKVNIFLRCSILFIDVLDERPSSASELERISSKAISLFDDEIFYIFKSTALKKMIFTRVKVDIEHALDFHKKAIKRYPSFDLYANLGIIYRYLFIDSEKKEYLKQSSYYLEKAFNLQKDDGILNLIVLNLGLLGEKEKIERILRDHSSLMARYDVNSILSRSKGKTMKPKIFEPEKIEDDIQKKDIDMSLYSDLKAINELCKEKKVKVIFLNYLQAKIPEMRLLKKEDDSVNFLDIYKIFGTENKDKKYDFKNIFLADGHLTGFGNEYVAEKLFTFIIQKEMVNTKVSVH